MHLCTGLTRAHLPRALILSVLISFSAVLFAQNGAPKYDASTETKMKGIVEDLKIPEKGHEKEIVHLVMKDGDQTVDLYLCPKSFIDDMGVTFSKGDEISITGSKITLGGSEMMLAREVVKGQDTLVLRDGKGKPVW